MTYSYVSPDKTWAWWTGKCTINGQGGFTFKVYVEDNEEPGKNDAFAITLFDSGVQIYYRQGFPILDRSIQIHK
jgi:hypothetical protein